MRKSRTNGTFANPLHPRSQNSSSQLSAKDENSKSSENVPADAPSEFELPPESSANDEEERDAGEEVELDTDVLAKGEESIDLLKDSNDAREEETEEESPKSRAVVAGEMSSQSRVVVGKEKSSQLSSVAKSAGVRVAEEEMSPQTRVVAVKEKSSQSRLVGEIGNSAKARAVVEEKDKSSQSSSVGESRKSAKARVVDGEEMLSQSHKVAEGDESSQPRLAARSAKSRVVAEEKKSSQPHSAAKSEKFAQSRMEVDAEKSCESRSTAKKVKLSNARVVVAAEEEKSPESRMEADEEKIELDEGKSFKMSTKKNDEEDVENSPNLCEEPKRKKIKTPSQDKELSSINTKAISFTTSSTSVVQKITSLNFTKAVVVQKMPAPPAPKAAQVAAPKQVLILHEAIDDISNLFSSVPIKNINDALTEWNGDFFKAALDSAGLILPHTSSLEASASASLALHSGRPVSIFMDSLASSIRGPGRVNQFIEGMLDFLQDDENLKRALLPLRANDSGSVSGWGTHAGVGPSLIRLLLKIDAVQANLIQTLLDKFLALVLENETGPMDDDSLISPTNDVPKKILASLCWLDFVVKPCDLAEHFLQCLGALSDGNSRWFRDTVSVLPEIFPDSEHARAVDHLMKLLRDTRDAAVPLIDALSDLTIPSSSRSELIETVLNVLKSAPLADVPLVVRFLMKACVDSEKSSQITMLREMRTRLTFLEVKSVAKPQLSGKSSAAARRRTPALDDSDEALVLKELHHGLLIYSSLSDAYFESLKVSNETCADVWLLVALSRSSSHANQAIQSLKRIALNTNGEGSSLFQRSIIGHRGALEGFFNEWLDWCGTLVRMPISARGSETLRSLGGNSYRWLYEEMADGRSRQEIIHMVAAHCSAGKASRLEVNSALKCLSDLVESDAGTTSLAPFSGYVRSLMNDVDERFDLNQSRTLFRVVSRLAAVDGEGSDELKIFLRKLLMSSETARQMCGIVGTVQLGICLAPFYPTTSTRNMKGPAMENDDDNEFLRNPQSQKRKRRMGGSSSARRRNCQSYDDESMGEEETTTTNTTTTNATTSSLMGLEDHTINQRRDPKESLALIDQMLRETGNPFTFEELGRAVECNQLDMNVVVMTLFTTVNEAFEEWFAGDTICHQRFDSMLIDYPYFGLENAQTCEITIQILGLLDKAQKDPRAMERMNLIAPMLRCLLACAKAVPGAVPSALMVCSLMLPPPMTLEALGDRAAIIRDATCTSFFHACDWFREVISSFSSNDLLESGMRFKLCMRLGSLVEAQGMLLRAVEQCPDYLPPGYTSRVDNSKKRSGDSSKSAKSVKRNDKGKAKTAVVKNLKQNAATTTTTNFNQDSHEDEADLGAEEPPASDDENDSDASEAEEVRLGDEEKTLKKKAETKQQLVDAAKIRTLASLREISPKSFSLFSLPGLTFAFNEKALLKSTSKRPRMLVSGARILLEICSGVLSRRLESSARAPFWALKKNVPTEGLISVQRAHEFEPEELVKLAVDHVFPAGKILMTKICKRLVDDVDEDAVDEDVSDEPIPAHIVRDSVACIEALCSSLSSVVRYEPLRRSHHGSALLLQGLRSFLPDGASISSWTIRNPTMTEDAPARTDARSLLADATCGAFRFFIKSVSESGALSNSLGTQITVVSLLKDLAALYDDLSGREGGSGEKEVSVEHVTLRNELSVLAKSLLRREWKAPAGLAAVKLGKTNLGVLIDTFLDYSSTPVESTVFTVDELKNFFASEELSEHAYAKIFPELDSKTFSLFYGSALSSLAKYQKSRSIHNEELVDLKRTCESFSQCMLMTKSSRAKATYLREAARWGRVFVEAFVKSGMPILSKNLKRDQDGVMQSLQSIQQGTRQLQNLCMHGKANKDAVLMGMLPPLRKALESLIMGVKVMLKSNNLLAKSGFFVGVLKARNIDGSLFKPGKAESEEDEVAEEE